jgi:hypothetical protein
MAVLASVLLALVAAAPQAQPPRAGVMVTVDGPEQVSHAVIARRLVDSEAMAAHGTPAPYYGVALNDRTTRCQSPILA